MKMKVIRPPIDPFRSFSSLVRGDAESRIGGVAATVIGVTSARHAAIARRSTAIPETLDSTTSR
jgi:hypothetical protein